MCSAGIMIQAKRDANNFTMVVVVEMAIISTLKELASNVALTW